MEQGGKKDIKINTKGYCFVCYNKKEETTPDGQGDAASGEPDKISQTLLGTFCQNLNIDVGELWKKIVENYDIPGGNQNAGGGTNWIGTLCSRCTMIASDLSYTLELKREVDEHLKDCINIFRQRIMLTEVQNGVSKEYQTMVRNDRRIFFHSELVDRLRIELYAKLSTPVGQLFEVGRQESSMNTTITDDFNRSEVIDLSFKQENNETGDKSKAKLNDTNITNNTVGDVKISVGLEPGSFAGSGAQVPLSEKDLPFAGEKRKHIHNKDYDNFKCAFCLQRFSELKALQLHHCPNSGKSRSVQQSILITPAVSSKSAKHCSTGQQRCSKRSKPLKQDAQIWSGNDDTENTELQRKEPSASADESIKQESNFNSATDNNGTVTDSVDGIRVKDQCYYKAGLYHCKTCGDSFKSQGGFYNHFKAKHTGAFFSCEACGFTSTWAQSFIGHKNRCKKMMMKKSEAEAVIEQETIKPTFTLESRTKGRESTSGKQFSTTRKVVSALKMYSGSLSGTQILNATVIRYRCKTCNIYFNGKSELFKHRFAFHRETCEHCGEKLLFGRLARRHRNKCKRKSGDALGSQQTENIEETQQIDCEGHNDPEAADPLFIAPSEVDADSSQDSQNNDTESFTTDNGVTTETGGETFEFVSSYSIGNPCQIQDILMEMESESCDNVSPIEPEQKVPEEDQMSTVMINNNFEVTDPDPEN